MSEISGEQIPAEEMSDRLRRMTSVSDDDGNTEVQWEVEEQEVPASLTKKPAQTQGAVPGEPAFRADGVAAAFPGLFVQEPS
jgi:hypothetical protein